MALPMTKTRASPPASPLAAAAPSRAPGVVVRRLLHAVPPQVLVALLLTAVVSVVILAISEYSSGRIAQTRADVVQARRAATQVAALRNGLLQAESAQRGYLLAGSEQYLRPFNTAIEASRTSLVELATVSGDNLEWRGRAEALRPLVERKENEMRLTVLAAQQGERERAYEKIASGEGIALMEGISQRLAEFDGVLAAEVERREAVLDESWLYQRIAVGVVVLLNLVFLAIVANLMIRQFQLRAEHHAALQRQTDALERTVADRTSELFDLSSYLQTSIEREKARLARDLHDELGGILTSAKIDIAWLESRLGAGDSEALARLRRLAGVLDEGVDLKRRVVENLRPSLLDHLGLGAALAWYVDETCSKAGLACTRRTALPDDEPVPPETAIAIYRTVQESLTNIVKHAQASQVEVAVEPLPDGWRLTVADDGVGISNFRAESLSHGLANMKQRARALGGRFTLRTAPGHGTRIEAFYPRPAAAMATAPGLPPAA
jgi:signal transduction histidine kinase